MTIARRAVDALLGSAVAGTLLRPLVLDRASVFMLHRFQMPELGVSGHDPGALRKALGALRRERVNIVALDRLLIDLAHGRSWQRPVVAFTIDDGYIDQALVGAPVFAEFDCPVTTFVSSGFLDRRTWFWWDQIELVFRRAPYAEISTAIGADRIDYRWQDDAGRRRAQADFTERCKRVPDATKLAAIERLARAAEVEIPAVAPAQYGPMSWDQLRACEDGGMAFGPHTVTHPILSQTTDSQSRYEIAESWRRLRQEARSPVAVFCYPNGQSTDFGPREIATLREFGIDGAVVGGRDGTGYAGREGFAAPDARYRVRRFAYAESVPEMLQIVNGVERLKQIVRRES